MYGVNSSSQILFLWSADTFYGVGNTMIYTAHCVLLYLIRFRIKLSFLLKCSQFIRMFILETWYNLKYIQETIWNEVVPGFGGKSHWFEYLQGLGSIWVQRLAKEFSIIIIFLKHFELKQNKVTFSLIFIYIEKNI